MTAGWRQKRVKCTLLIGYLLFFSFVSLVSSHLLHPLFPPTSHPQVDQARSHLLLHHFFLTYKTLIVEYITVRFFQIYLSMYHLEILSFKLSHHSHLSRLWPSKTLLGNHGENTDYKSGYTVMIHYSSRSLSRE